jgi:hypothetical protein
VKFMAACGVGALANVGVASWAHSGAASAAAHSAAKRCPPLAAIRYNLFEVSYWEGLGYRTFCRATDT